MSDNQRSQKAITSNLSTEKALSILEVLAEYGSPMRLLDITTALGSSPSTVLRFLTSLQSCGYVRQDKETTRYSLTFKICRIANKLVAGTRINEVAHPYLREVSIAFGESVCLAVEQDMTVVYIDVEEGTHQTLRSMQRIGNVAPMHCTGIGKLLLLNYTEAQLDKLIKQKGLAQFTERTITKKPELVRALVTIGEYGYAYDDEECEIGARCVAYPIRDYTGHVVAGISVTGPVSRMSFDVIDQKRDKLKEAADKISLGMGYEPMAAKL